MHLPAIKALIEACEREYLCDDEPDDSDICMPPCGITMGMIRSARKEHDATTASGKLLRRLGAAQRK